MKHVARCLAIGIALFGAGAALAQPAPLTPLSTANQSATITTGNTFQQVLAASAFRHSLTIQNNNASDSCWIAFGAVNGTAITAGNATKAESILLTAGGSFQRYYPYVPIEAIIATCASNGDTLYIDTQ